MSRAIDPVTLEVIRGALTAAAEEMSLVVMRSARSPLLREAGDLSSALTDAAGEMIAQGRDIPMHLGVMCFTVKEFLKLVPRAALAPGDVWFLNLPEIGGNHLPDVKAIRPVFAEGELFAFAVSLAHWADIGGAAPGSYYAGATDIWQEGLRIAPTRLFTASGADDEKLQLVLANVRGAVERDGDIHAQMAATLVAERRLGELVGEHGRDVVKAAMAELQDRSEQQMRAAIRALPRGVFEG
jgi:N-methylhydantoinase B